MWNTRGRMRINPEHLITFSVVAELSSVSRAAQILQLSQPAVSGHLRALQEQMGTPLYSRRGRGIQLTAAGERLLPHAQAVALSVQEAAALTAGAHAPSRAALQIGFSATLTSAVSSVVRLGAERGLQIQADTHPTTELAAAVRAGTLAAALIVTSPHRHYAELDSHRLGEDTLRLAVLPGHPLADQGYVPPHALRGETLLWSAPGSGVRRQAERLLEGVRSGTRGLELGSPWAVLEGVRRGHGVSLLPASFLTADVQAGRLVSLGLEAPDVTLLHALLTLPAPLPPSTGLLLDLLSRHSLRALLVSPVPAG